MNKKALFALPLVTALLAGCAGKQAYPCKDYEMFVKWSDPTKDFRILQLTDIHFSQSDYFERHFKIMDKTIKDANADLIVLNGDSFTYADKGVVAKLFSFIDSYDIPWTFTYGNHDDQGYFSDAYIQRVLADKTLFKNVKFINLEDDNVSGRSNFMITIYQREKDGGGVWQNKDVFQVYALESHSYNFDTIAYDFIKQDQINWYESMVNYSKEKHGGVALPSAMYFHIPTPEFFDAWKYVEDGHPEALLAGTTDEYSGGPTPESDTHIFDKIKELGSTLAISVAHDHINDSVIMYEGIALCFGVHATDRIYYDENKIGGQVVVVDKNDQSHLTFENIYHHYSEVEGK